MLKDTLVVWGGEFGRTPFNEKGRAAITTRGASPSGWRWRREKAARRSGPTDEIGMYATEQKSHVNDIHASILWLWPRPPSNDVYCTTSRAERPTVVAGEVIKLCSKARHVNTNQKPRDADEPRIKSLINADKTGPFRLEIPFESRLKLLALRARAQRNLDSARALWRLRGGYQRSGERVLSMVG